jgi:hypothetical protein
LPVLSDLGGISGDIFAIALILMIIAIVAKVVGEILK